MQPLCCVDNGTYATEDAPVHTLTYNIVLSLQPKYHTLEFAKASVTLNIKSTLSGMSCG
jgi:hypothetical protein